MKRFNLLLSWGAMTRDHLFNEPIPRSIIFTSIWALRMSCRRNGNSYVNGCATWATTLAIKVETIASVSCFSVCQCLFSYPWQTISSINVISIPIILLCHHRIIVSLSSFEMSKNFHWKCNISHRVPWNVAFYIRRNDVVDSLTADLVMYN